VAAAVAVKTGCAVVPARAELLDSGRYRLHYDAPLRWEPTGERSQDIACLTQALTARIEEWVRETPEQWLWIHRRWKTQPGQVVDPSGAAGAEDVRAPAPALGEGPRGPAPHDLPGARPRACSQLARGRRVVAGALRDLRRNLPEARIEVLARPWVADLYRAVSEIDGVRSCPSFREGVAAARGFDAAILLPNSFASALMVWLAGVPERWGYARDGRGALLTRRARVPRQVRGESEAFYYRALIAGVGLKVAASPDLSLACGATWRTRGAELLGERGPWIGLSPGAAFGSAKRWPAERYAAVGDALAVEQDARVAILGSAAERATGEWMAKRMLHPARVLCGDTSLADLIGVLANLKLLVTNDSGPMHVAAALGIPVLAIFGPTDWRETAPRGRDCRLVREPVPCAPCKLRECPIDHRCMEGVSVARVLSEARGLLGRDRMTSAH